MGEKQRELQGLFHTWKRFHEANGCDPNKFVADGIVGEDESAYVRSKPRVLFLLKDANDSNNVQAGADFDLCNLWRHPDKFTSHRKTTERVCGMWAYGMHALAGERSANAEEAGREYLSGLLKSAVINLKKSAGVATVSTAKIRAFAKQDRCFILREIEILEPDVVVCGGTNMLEEVMQRIFGGFRPLDGSRYCFRWNASAAIWIDHCHPAKQGLAEAQNYNSLMQKYPR